MLGRRREGSALKGMQLYSDFSSLLHNVRLLPRKSFWILSCRRSRRGVLQESKFMVDWVVSGSLHLRTAGTGTRVFRVLGMRLTSLLALHLGRRRFDMWITQA